MVYASQSGRDCHQNDARACNYPKRQNVNIQDWGDENTNQEKQHACKMKRKTHGVDLNQVSVVHHQMKVNRKKLAYAHLVAALEM